MVATDSVVVLLSVLLAQILSVGRDVAVDADLTAALAPWLFTTALIVFWLTALAVEGVWDLAEIGNGSAEFRRAVVASLVVFAVVGLLGYFSASDLARSYLLVAAPVGTLGLVAGHAAWRRWLTAHRRAGGYFRSVVVVGDRPRAAALCSLLTERRDAGYQVAGVILLPEPTGPAERVDGLQGVPILGALGDVADAVVATAASTVAITASPLLDTTQVSELVARLDGTGVRLLVEPRVVAIAGPQLQLRPLVGLPLLWMSEPRFRGGQRFTKGALDLFVAAISIVLLFPLMTLAAIAVLAADGGPVLYQQEFVGRDGKPFRVWAFRTTPHGAKARPRTGLEPGTPGEPRYHLETTRIGRLLTRTGLAESPRLLAVLTLQMSMVGPQPQAPGDQAERPRVRPGLTGPWRVSGRRTVGAVERAQLDAYYVRDWSVVGDLLIIVQTAGLMVTGKYSR